MTRESWDDYFFRIADDVATRATCPRLHVGAVLVRDNRIIVTGYNGSLPGEAHCEDAGCEMVDGHCTRTIHAELNAILHAAKEGISTNGTIAYLTHEPCSRCEKHLRAAGVIDFKYRNSRKREARQVGSIYGVPMYIEESVSSEQLREWADAIHFGPGTLALVGVHHDIALAERSGKRPPAVLVKQDDWAIIQEDQLRSQLKGRD